MKKRKRGQASRRKQDSRSLNTILPSHMLRPVQLLECATLELFGDRSREVAVAVIHENPIVSVAHLLAVDGTGRLGKAGEKAKLDAGFVPTTKKSAQAIKGLNIARLICRDIHVVLLGLDDVDFKLLSKVYRPLDFGLKYEDYKDRLKEVSQRIMRKLDDIVPAEKLQFYEKGLQVRKRWEQCIDNVEEAVKTGLEFARYSEVPFSLSPARGFVEVNEYLSAWYGKGFAPILEKR